MNERARHYIAVLVVFAITGSLAVMLSRLLLHEVLQLDGGFIDGPWSYRLVYLVLIPPSYSVMLVAVGTLFGKRKYFTRRVLRIWGRPLRLIRGGPKPGADAPPRDR